MAGIYDARLDLDENFGTNSTYRFKNTVTVTQDGSEYRHGLWDSPIAEFNISKAVVSLAELQYVLAFFNTVKGQELSFRFRDWSDYQMTAKLTDTGLGITTQGVCVPNNNPAVSATHQLCKAYYLRDRLNKYHVYYRKITRPVINTFVPYSTTGNVITGSVTSIGGLVTLTATGYVACDCTYDVPVRFAEDISYEMLSGYDKLDPCGYAATIQQIRMVEVNADTLIPVRNNYGV